LFRLMSESWVPFSRYIFNTAFVAAAGTFGHLFFASLAAYAMTKIKFPGRQGMFKLVYYSLMFNSTVSALSNFIIMSIFGWIDTYWSLIIPAFGSTLGFYLMRQFMESTVPDSVLESARLDGAKELLIYWRIVMPMVKPAWLTLIVYSFQGLWNSGTSIYIYSEELKTFNYAIQQILAGGIVRSGAAAAATVIMMLVPVTVFIITQSNIIETMASSGMKD
ncbi:MAG: carbohydrate ABC transporter permease, partial [Clostridia bacterium]|nr:carbohydrate ABC transporter permease [Clostridia bacterium]